MFLGVDLSILKLFSRLRLSGLTVRTQYLAEVTTAETLAQTLDFLELLLRGPRIFLEVCVPRYTAPPFQPLVCEPVSYSSYNTCVQAGTNPPTRAQSGSSVWPQLLARHDHEVHKLKELH